MKCRYRATRRSIQLRLEHDAAISRVCDLPAGHRQEFWRLVGPPGQRLDVGGIGLLPIAHHTATSQFEPAECGPTAIIIPVRDGPRRNEGELIDLLAWLPRSGETLTRYGIAQVLGPWLLGPLPDPEIRIFSDPGCWCRSNGAGVFVIDWAASRALLGHFDRLVVDDLDFGRRLRKAIQPPRQPAPQIFIEEVSHEKAA
jgi:hypothetical protein